MPWIVSLPHWTHRVPTFLLDSSGGKRKAAFSNGGGSSSGHADGRSAADAPVPKRAARGEGGECQLPKFGFIANAEMVKFALPYWCSMTTCLPDKGKANCLQELERQAAEVGGFLNWCQKISAKGRKNGVFGNKRYIVKIVTTVGHAWPMWLHLRQVIVAKISEHRYSYHAVAH